jgi:hypothetical protein
VENNLMTYLFSSNVEVSNDIGNPLPITVTNTNGNIVSLANPFPVTLGSNSIQIIGNISIPTTVNVASSSEDPVHTHITEIGTSGNLLALGINYMPIGGNVGILGNVTVLQGTNPWTVNGSVGITSIGNINISNTSLPVSIQGNVNVNPISVTGITSNVNVNPLSATVSGNIGILNTNGNIVSNTNPFPVTGNLTATITGTSTVTLGTGSTDAFGRLRTSQPYTLFDSRARYYDHNDFSNVNVTGGTVVYNADSSTYLLNVTASSGSSVIRETKRVFPYQPGKSLLVLATFCMNTPKTNLRQRVGYFTTNNGVYFENDGTYNYLVIRSYSSGALVEDRVRQDAWDNPFAALNVDRTQIFWIDVEWLGVGSVRCGFVINGAYVLCHTFHHANIIGNTTTYMTTATLPVRYEITNTAATAGTSMMRQICSTVISEGGYNAFTYSETAGRGTSVLRLSSAGTYYPVVSIRLDSTRLDAIVLPRQVDVLSPTVNYYRWKLVLNPTLTGADWAGTSTSGTVEYDTAATAISGGIELQAGYVSSRELSELGADAFAFQLGRTLAGVSDIVTLAMAATSNNADVLAQIGWQEIT